ncbi:MAG: Brix domain-containing protein [Candidatus Bathyarchaeia archaeon]
MVYYDLGEVESIILITTSRRPTQRVRSFFKDLERVIPGARRVNRGKLSMEGVAERVVELGGDRVILIERWKGGPGKVGLYRLRSGKLDQAYPVLYLAGVKTQDEYGQETRIRRGLVVTVSKQSSKRIKRIAQALADFLKIGVIEADSGGLEFQASLHISPAVGYEARLVFTTPPVAMEVGPAMVVRRTIWEKPNGGH